MAREPLRDGHGRLIGDLRVSVTDRCNFRCQYCMPAEGLPWLDRAELLHRGHADRMFLSQDFCATIDWYPPEAEEMFTSQGLVREDWSMTLVFDEVIPALREEGALTDDHLQTILVDNPRRWLTGS